jgi:hypothetical protein
MQKPAKYCHYFHILDNGVSMELMKTLQYKDWLGSELWALTG